MDGPLPRNAFRFARNADDEIILCREAQVADRQRPAEAVVTLERALDVGDALMEEQVGDEGGC